MRSYGGFCPIAKAVEVVGDRWTLLIIRELLSDTRHFNDFRHALPGIPRSLLSKRLRLLEDAGVVTRREEGRRVEYHLTVAGKELYDVIWGLGAWGQRWVNLTIGAEDVEPEMLMWDMHRRIHVDQLPAERVVAQFDFRGVARGTYWMLLERPEPSVCLVDPGFQIDLLITTDTVALHRVWMGHLDIYDAIGAGSIVVEGTPALVKAFPSWLALNLFAGISPAARVPT
jgi:DNA-binding HxlR family transcriptional regulator